MHPPVLPQPSWPTGKYKLIYADPPWDYNDKRTRKSTGAVRGAYLPMALADIHALPVRELATHDAMLAMWATWPKLPEALATIKAWGFEYVTCGFVWLKLNKHADYIQFTKWDVWSGIGHYTASNTEFCLFGRRGAGLSRPGQLHVKQVIITPHTGIHSRKPADARVRLVQLFGPETSRIELFATQRIDGWDAWGNALEEE